MFSLLFAWLSFWTNRGVVGDFRHLGAHVTVMTEARLGWCVVLLVAGHLTSCLLCRWPFQPAGRPRLGRSSTGPLRWNRGCRHRHWFEGQPRDGDHRLKTKQQVPVPGGQFPGTRGPGGYTTTALLCWYVRTAWISNHIPVKCGMKLLIHS